MNKPYGEAGSNPFGRVRTVPVHLNELPTTELENAAQNKGEHGANLSEPSALNDVSFEDVWLTVDEAVAHCEARGLSRTAKTIRKWAERSFNLPEGEVVSDREDTLWGRYRWKIEQKSLDRKITEELSREAALANKPVQTGANLNLEHPSEIASEISTNTFEPVQTSAIKSAPRNLDEQSTNSFEQADAVRTREHVLPVSEFRPDEIATLRAENKELRKRQERDQDEIKFLREEVTFNRSLKTDFAQNSKQLLETLETLAVGGRLDRSSTSSVQPVRYQAEEVVSDDV